MARISDLHQIDAGVHVAICLLFPIAWWLAGLLVREFEQQSMNSHIFVGKADHCSCGAALHYRYQSSFS